MRVIAGQLGGRSFTAPKGHRTHPMSDKARGGLFNALGDVSGLTVLDAMAGSGALSFEAISRGADRALAIESDRAAQRAITENIDTLGLDGQVKLVKANVGSWSSQQTDQIFDLIFIDPPYNQLQTNLVQKLTKHLKPSGTLVLSWPSNLVPAELVGLHIVKQKSYGDAQLVFYQSLK